jgi:hypothetical protein
MKGTSALGRCLVSVGLPLTLALLLSGCMSVERQFQLNGDGSGSWDYSGGLAEQA